MNALFRLHGGKRHDENIDWWLGQHDALLGNIAQEWFNEIRSCGSDVLELMHDGCPTACVEDAAFAYVGVYKKHVSVGFYRGAELPDPAGLLQGSGKNMRHVKLHPQGNTNAPALAELIRASYTDMAARVARGDP